MRWWWMVLLVGCRAGPDSVAPSDDTIAFVVDGLPRTMLAHVPANAANLPVVFDLHGSGGTMKAQQASSDLDAKANQMGFMVVYLQGAIPSGDGFQWHLPGEPLVDGPEPASAPDDVEYVRRAILVLAERYPIDSRRIYVTGFSGGARMASQLACDLPQIVAAAPLSGLRYPGRCQSRRVSIIAFHGTADQNNPFNGDGGAFWTYGVPAAILNWAINDGCATVPTVTTAGSTVARWQYAGCASGALVELYVLDGGGHTVPTAIDSTEVMWEVFRRLSF